MGRRGFAPFILIAIVALAVALGAGVWFAIRHAGPPSNSNSNTPPGQNNPPGIACTQEAKQCPDGSYVGRTGPNCEFAACPGASSTGIDVSNWKVYQNETRGFELRYPAGWNVPINATDVVMLSTATADEIEHGLGVPVPDNVWVEIVAAKSCAGVVVSSDFETEDFGAAEPMLEKTVCNGGVVITLGAWSSDPQLDNHKKLLNQILSTFKFLQPTSTVDTSGWKTYANQQSGFSIKYPPRWSSVVDSTSTVSFFPPGKHPDPALEYNGDIILDIYANPLNFSIQQFEKQSNQDLFQYSSSQSSSIINGYPLIKFTNVLGMIPNDVYVMQRGLIFVEVTDFNDNADVVSGMLASIQQWMM